MDEGCSGWYVGLSSATAGFEASPAPPRWCRARRVSQSALWKWLGRVFVAPRDRECANFAEAENQKLSGQRRTACEDTSVCIFPAAGGRTASTVETAQAGRFLKGAFWRFGETALSPGLRPPCSAPMGQVKKWARERGIKVGWCQSCQG